MSIKTRLTRLEQKQPSLSSPFQPGPVALIGVNPGDTDDQACQRWLIENPGQALPANRIYLVPFTP